MILKCAFVLVTVCAVYTTIKANWLFNYTVVTPLAGTVVMYHCQMISFNYIVVTLFADK